METTIIMEYDMEKKMENEMENEMETGVMYRLYWA